MSKEEILNVACPKCRVAKGERCQTSGGREMPPSQSHNARIRVWGRMNASAEALAVKPELQEPKATVDVPSDEELDRQVEEHMANALRVSREERIVAVLQGIAFARKIGTSQDQIDRNLAAMIVDASLDL
jgi:hypothetical protein